MNPPTTTMNIPMTVEKNCVVAVRPNFATTNPSPIVAIPVRSHARYVLSFARYARTSTWATWFRSSDLSDKDIRKSQVGTCL